MSEALLSNVCVHGNRRAVDDVEFTEGMTEIYDEMPEEM